MKAQEWDQLLGLLKSRFENYTDRHRGVEWKGVLARLESNSTVLKTLSEMEDSGGGPDVIGQDNATGQFIFCDSSPESPIGRRSLCYDG